MNKYLKILMLSGGLVGSISATAIDFDKDKHSDLGNIYEQVERMQQALPRLSRINYKLNIDLNEDNIEKNNYEQDLLNEDTDISEAIEDVNNIVNDNTNLNNDIDETLLENNVDTYKEDANISFVTSDENGNEVILTEEETINYLDQTLNQTNIEYEQLKTTLSNAIKDTMDYLDAYKNGETTLTNEQKIYIKEHTNSIKFLAETLEDLSEEVICCIDDCCPDDTDFEETASKYLSVINDLETRINALNNAIASLQFVNNIGNPLFFAMGPNHMLYGYHNFNNTDKQYPETSIEDEDYDNTTDIEDIDSNLESNNTDSQQSENNDTNNDNTVTDDDTASANVEDDKPTTFGLKSNIDTYAPTNRNIDTFFNTALYNRNDYMNGYGYGAPYGGGYGYGMPYNQGFYGNPYGHMGANSNMINRDSIESQPTDTNSDSSSLEKDNKKDIKKPKKIRSKRTSNIDTYNDVTIQSNINTMGESKISKFFSEKLNNLRKKIRKQKDNINNNLPSDNQDKLLDDTQNTDLNSEIVDNNIINSENTDLANMNELQNNTDTSLPNVKENIEKDFYSNIDNTIIPKQEKEIKAQ